MLEFPGRDKLVAALDAAVASGEVPAIVAATRTALQRLQRDDAFMLPDALRKPVAEHYARRLLYASPQHGYSVIAMTWGPGQGTPLHDHSGLWCVEGVWQGGLQVTEYDLLEGDEPHYRFAARRTFEAAAGTTDGLTPPDEYHAIRNPSAGETAISLHIYQGTMQRCNTFVPCERGGGWHLRSERQLGTDALDAP